MNARRIETIRRLVEDQQVGIVQEGEGQSESLAHTERVFAHTTICVFREFDSCECKFDQVAIGTE